MRVILMAGDGVRSAVLAGDGFIAGGKAPPALQHLPVHARVRDDVFQPFELARDEDAVRPGAGVGDVEMVAVLFGWEFGVGGAAHEVAEDALGALEEAGFVVGPVEDAVFVGGLGSISLIVLLFVITIQTYGHDRRCREA